MILPSATGISGILVAANSAFCRASLDWASNMSSTDSVLSAAGVTPAISARFSAFFAATLASLSSFAFLFAAFSSSLAFCFANAFSDLGFFLSNFSASPPITPLKHSLILLSETFHAKHFFFSSALATPPVTEVIKATNEIVNISFFVLYP